MTLSRPTTRLRWRRVGLAIAAGLAGSFLAGYGLGARRSPEGELRSAPKSVRSAAPQTLDVVAKNRSLRALACEIGARAGRRVSVDEELEQDVSVGLRGVTWSSALRMLADLSGGVYEETASGARLRRRRGLTIQATDADLRSVIAMIASHAGKNVMIGPRVQGRLTLDLKGVRWDRALRGVAASQDCELIVEEGRRLLRVVKKRS